MKKTVCAGLASIGWLLLAVIRRSQNRSRGLIQRSIVSKPAELARIEGTAHRVMMTFIVPLWIAVGLLDYIWHRRTQIERTSGRCESLLHLLMLAEGGPVILAPVLLEVNAGVLSLMHAGYLAHQATAMWDVDSTVTEHLIPPDEQHIHAYLEGIPFTIVALYTAIHWNQFLALLGIGRERPRFDLLLKKPKLPLRDAVMLTAAVNALDILPHMEEYWRCWKAERRGLKAVATPACAPVLFGGKV